MHDGRSRTERKRPIAGGPDARAARGALALVATGSGCRASSRAGDDRQGRRIRRGVPGEDRDAQEDALQRHAPPGEPVVAQDRTGGIRPRRQEGQPDLALKCWKNNGCSTGTGGKLTVAYVEQFGENVYRQMSKMEFILQALTYPQVGKIIYTSAHSDLTQGIADFNAAIAQKVSLIVTLSGLRRRDAAGDEGGDRRRHPRRDVCVGLSSPAPARTT